MPDPCENCSSCASCPWCPGCDPCGPPSGLVAPNNGKPKLGDPATFYGWENGHDYAARIDTISEDGLFCGVTIFTIGPDPSKPIRGEYFYERLPLVSKDHDDKKLKSVKNYLHEREEFLEIVGRHMHAFGEQWKASGNPTPMGGFVRAGAGTGECIIPRQEGRDCLALILKDPGLGLVDLRLIYASGKGESNAYGVPVLTPEMAQSARALRSLYVTMRKPHWDAAIAEWDSKY